MNKETNLQKVKEVAISLLNLPILETEYTPIIVSHPFTNCGIVTLLEKGNYVQLDITRNKGALIKWQNQIEKQIKGASSVYHIYYFVNVAYRMMFFNEIHKLLSNEDFSSLLGDVWTESDYSNSDVNVSKKEMLSHFKNADKFLLMSESEIQKFEELPDSLVIYRGLSTKNKNNIMVLSWTTNFEKAKWFAERWGERGVVYSAVIKKRDVYAYFDRKNEDEIIVDYNKLENIKVAKNPIYIEEDTTSILLS